MRKIREAVEEIGSSFSHKNSDAAGPKPSNHGGQSYTQLPINLFHVNDRNQR